MGASRCEESYFFSAESWWGYLRFDGLGGSLGALTGLCLFVEMKNKDYPHVREPIEGFKAERWIIETGRREREPCARTWGYTRLSWGCILGLKTTLERANR